MNYKKLGQIFLKNKNVIELFINSINPNKNDNIIEIGSGLGSITKEILKYVNNLIAIEIDNSLSRTLILNLNEEFKKKISFIKEDARFINYNKFYKKNKKIRIFGSLPYYASVKILINCINYINIISDMYFIIQKELSDRIISKNNNKKYGRLTVLIQSFFKTELIYDNIKSDCFYPIPKVNSSIIKLIPNDKYNFFYKRKYLEKVTKYAFAKKRKIIKNNLLSLFNLSDLLLLEKLNILNLNSRSENLSIKQFCDISDFYISLNKIN